MHPWSCTLLKKNSYENSATDTHDHILQSIAGILKGKKGIIKCTIEPKKEKFPTSEELKLKNTKPDIKILLSDYPTEIYGDLTIVNITSASYVKKKINSVLKTASTNKKNKHNNYDIKSDFFPMVISSYGNFEKEFLDLLNQVSTSIENSSFYYEKHQRRQIYYELIDTILIKNAIGQALLLQAGSNLSLNKELSDSNEYELSDNDN